MWWRLAAVCCCSQNKEHKVRNMRITQTEMDVLAIFEGWEVGFCEFEIKKQ